MGRDGCVLRGSIHRGAGCDHRECGAAEHSSPIVADGRRPAVDHQCLRADLRWVPHARGPRGRQFRKTPSFPPWGGAVHHVRSPGRARLEWDMAHRRPSGAGNRCGGSGAHLPLHRSGAAAACGRRVVGHGGQRRIGRADRRRRAGTVLRLALGLLRERPDRYRTYHRRPARCPSRRTGSRTAANRCCRCRADHRWADPCRVRYCQCRIRLVEFTGNP